MSLGLRALFRSTLLLDAVLLHALLQAVCFGLWLWLWLALWLLAAFVVRAVWLVGLLRNRL